MPDVTIVYWRDIPAQVIVGRGRTGAKVQLSRAVRAGDRPRRDEGRARRHRRLPRRVAARERRPGPDLAPEEAAAEAARALEASHPPERLRALVDNGGRAPAGRPA